MVVLNVAVVSSDELARSIAKASDQRDVHTYIHKEVDANGVRILSLIRPAKYPERLRPFLNALSTAQAGLIEVNAIDATLGEVLVAFASAGIKRGVAVLNPLKSSWLDESQVHMLFKQAGLADWTFVANDGIMMREHFFGLINEIHDTLLAHATSPLVLPVDQHFNVRGIGLVAIGYVQCGTIRVHDELLILPANGSGTAKSLQVMDDDVQVASAGDRVGIALRNTKEEHISGSSILIHPAVHDKKTNTTAPLALEQHKSSILTLKLSPFQKRGLQVGDVIHASVDLQFVVGRVLSVQDTQVEVEWEHSLYIRHTNPQPILIAQLDAKPRIMGSAFATIRGN